MKYTATLNVNVWLIPWSVCGSTIFGSVPGLTNSPAYFADSFSRLFLSFEASHGYSGCIISTNVSKALGPLRGNRSNNLYACWVGVDSAYKIKVYTVNIIFIYYYCNRDWVCWPDSLVGKSILLVLGRFESRSGHNFSSSYYTTFII